MVILSIGSSNILCAPEWRRHVEIVRQITELAIGTDVANTLISPGRSVGLLDDTFLIVGIEGLNTVGKWEITKVAATFKSGGRCTLAIKTVGD